LIRAVGEALFGQRWQSDLADHLAVNRRTVRRWASGDDEPRTGVWLELQKLLSERAKAQIQLREAIRSRHAPP
jgi:predicted transcriptional regulator